MHPVIRVVCLLLILVTASMLRPTLMGFLFILAIWLHLQTRGKALATAWRMLQRIRWLILAIVILYGWFTPGQVYFGGHYSSWSPTHTGIDLALSRTLALILIVLFVSHVLYTTSRDGLIGALYWLGRPLSRFGVSVDHLLLRLVLTFEFLGHIEGLLRESAISAKQHVPYWQRLTRRLAYVFEQTLQKAESQPLRDVLIVVPDAPDRKQWLIPLGFIILLILIARFG